MGYSFLLNFLQTALHVSDDNLIHQQEHIQGSRFLQTVGTYLPKYTASYPRKNKISIFIVKETADPKYGLLLLMIFNRNKAKSVTWLIHWRSRIDDGCQNSDASIRCPAIRTFFFIFCFETNHIIVVKIFIFFYLPLFNSVAKINYSYAEKMKGSVCPSRPLQPQVTPRQRVLN